MHTTAVKSTTLTTVTYDEDRELLQLEFCSGAIYLYLSVPEVVHRALLDAPSKGRYFNRAIRRQFPYHPIPRTAVVWDAEASAACDQ